MGLEPTASHTTVFIRDDDVGRLTTGLRRVVELLIEEAVPCNYQVVPTFLDDESVDFLRRTQAAHPGLVVLNQHGLRHEQELAGERVWSEFAGGRSYEDQHADIEAGARILRDRLGASFDPSVFTPPCHKYDLSTLRALEAIGAEILSAGVKVDRLSRLYYGIGRLLGRVSLLGKRVSYHGRTAGPTMLKELSVCIDVDEEKDDSGERVEKDLTRLWTEFTRCRPRIEAVGIMLHHELYDQPARVQTLRAFIRRLKAEPGVRFSTIGEIVGAAVDPVPER